MKGLEYYLFISRRFVVFLLSFISVIVFLNLYKYIFIFIPYVSISIELNVINAIFVKFLVESKFGVKFLSRQWKT